MESLIPSVSTVSSSASTGTNLGVSPRYDGYRVGTSFTISVEVSNVTKLYAYDLYLDFNSTSLSLTGVNCEAGTMFGNMPHFVVACGSGNSTGRVHVAETLEGNISANGEGHLLILTFTINNNASGASPLHVSNDSLIDSSFADIQHTTMDGVFYVDLPPIASFRVYPQGAEKPLLQGRVLVFNASSSKDQDSLYDPNGPTALECTWNFGDESPLSIGCSTIHTYSAMGNYNVTVSVTDNEGSTGTTTSFIAILINPDTDGNGCIDIRDIARVAFRFGTRVGDTMYDSLYDLNKDGTINIIDLVIAASSYGKCGYPIVDFSLTSNATSLTIVQGSNRTVTLALSAMNGFSGNITLTTMISPSISNAPIASLNQTTVSLPVGSTKGVLLSLTTSSSTIAADFTVTITASSQFHSHALAIPIQISKPETLHLEVYSFNSNNLNVSLSIRNAGSVSTNFTTYYITDASGNTWTQPTYTFGPSIQSNAVATLNIGIGASCGGCIAPAGGAFTSFVAGNSYTVKVVTTQSNSFVFTVQIGGLPSPPAPVGELLVLQSYSFSNGTLTTLNLSNNGPDPVSLVTYYVRDLNGNLYSKTNWSGAGITNQPANGLITAPVNIGAQCGCTAPSTPFSFQPGYSYTVIVVTSKNNEFVFTVTR